MRKSLKRTLLQIGVLVDIIIVLGIMYAINPYKVKRLFRLVEHTPGIFVDNMKGKPYSKSNYDGIDVSKHNGVIRWDEVAKNKKIKFVFIKATEGYGHVDPQYKKNIKEARMAGLKVGSYHFFTSRSSATKQFLYFKSVVKKSEQDLIPVLDVEKEGKKGCQWRGQQLQDSVRVFAELAKKHYGKYPIIYSGEHFYNSEMGHQFNKYYLFIAKWRIPEASAKLIETF